jgi:hypothetical protein
MISILITAALLAQQVSAPVAVKTRVEGHVINSLNGEAVPKATVVLRAHDQDHGPSYADETDGSGHFLIDDVEPGEYAVFAERPGFSFQSTGATGAPPPSVKVEKGQQVQGVKIPLTPLGAITGRVLDADGDPVRAASVEALRYLYSNGKRQLRSVEQVQSGDNGEFRLFGLRAATFYLKASPIRRNSQAKLPEVVSTYYPGTADERHAAPVELHAGVQLRGFDIRLQSAGVYSIRIQLPETKGPGSGTSVFLLNDQGFAHQGTNYSSEGVVLSGVPPGSYEVVAIHQAEGEKPSYARMPVEVVNVDVDAGTLTFVPAVDIAGSVRVEGGTFSGFEKVRVHIRPVHRSPIGYSDSDVKPNGSFIVKDAAPGAYEIGIDWISGVYLKSVRVGDKVLADRRIDIASKPEPLVIALGADVGEVEGSVHNAKGEPVVRARVNVIAYGDHSSRSDLNLFGFTDDKGEFKMKEVAPGEYKVFAWEDVPVGAPQDPEFRKPFEKQAASIRMQPNGHEKVSVTAIVVPQEDRSSQ